LFSLLQSKISETNNFCRCTNHETLRSEDAIMRTYRENAKLRTHIEEEYLERSIEDADKGIYFTMRTKSSPPWGLKAAPREWKNSLRTNSYICQNKNIYFAWVSVCFFVSNKCQKNELIRPKFCIGPHMTPGKV